MTAPAVIPVDYHGLLVQFTLDGWFNATRAARQWGKLPNDWLRLPTTTEYIDALKAEYGLIPYLRTRRGAYGGTWLHPKLAVVFARWLDVRFAIWCDRQIDALMRGSTLSVSRRRIEWEVRVREYRERGGVGSALLHECKREKPILKTEGELLVALSQPALPGIDPT